MERDPIEQNILGVQQLVSSRLNKVPMAANQTEGVEGEPEDALTLKLSDAELHGIHPSLTPDSRLSLTAQGAVESRISSLGTSPTSVMEQISTLQAENELAKRWIAGEAKRFTEMMES